MAENFTLVRECRRLETNTNVPAVDNYLQIRTLRIRNIPYDTKHRQIDILEEDRNLMSILDQRIQNKE